MDTNSNNSLKHFPSDLFVLSGLPILAIAFLTGLFFNLVPSVPLSPEGDPTLYGKIFGFGAACLILSIPIGFMAQSSAALFSRTIRERIRAHKWFNVLWGVASLLIFFSLIATGHGNPNSRGMRTARTRVELDQIYTGILAYETEYGAPLSTSDNRGVIEILKGGNERKIEFVTFSPWELDPKGEMIDGWGTPIRVSFRDPKKPLIQSAGPDRVWGTGDDLTGE